MDVIYGLIPGMIVLGLGMVVVFIFAARSGQFDDLVGAAHRILMDEDDPPPQGGGELSRQREGAAGDGEGEEGAAAAPPEGEAPSSSGDETRSN